MKKLSIFQKIVLLNKINKAYKASKKLIDSKKDLNKEVGKVLLNLKADLEQLSVLLPEYREPYNEIKVIIENAF